MIKHIGFLEVHTVIQPPKDSPGWFNAKELPVIADLESGFLERNVAEGAPHGCVGV